jgi:2-dehydro-3-deoxyphosphogluconate aldolase / (4S)-4-hydroxy-2-oxoglutarate aldolase
MTSKDKLLTLIPEQGVLPLFFYGEDEVCLEVLRVLYKSGIRAVEFTNRGSDAFRIFEKMRSLCDAEFHNLYLGIGTIKNSNSAKLFIDAGADFIVSPGFVEGVANIADKYNKLWVPGCMTPTEIIKAENTGAKMIKLFPGNLLGPAFMSSIKDLFPDLLFMPTGGVDLDEGNIAGWFKAGVCAVGMGSKLISKSLLEKKDYDSIEKLTRKALSIIKATR